MKSKITLNFCGFFTKGLAVFSAFILMAFFANAQYSNGPLSTGTTSSGGVVAPAGFTWSETQGTNTTYGNTNSVATNYSLADDFIVPTGQTWNTTKFTFYAYSTGYAGASSPFNNIRVRIFNSNPSVGAPVPVFGDLTTNRLLSSTTSNMYRIAPGLEGTTRQIWKIEATVVASLPAGTYWVEWQQGTIASVTSSFSPPKTVVGVTGQAGDNSLQHDNTLATWVAVADLGSSAPQDNPFIIDYTATGTACTAVPPGNTVSSAATVCPSIPFNLSVQTPGTGIGLSYQWQSGPALAGPFTDIGGATSATYTATQTVATYYRLRVTCGANPPQFSTPLQVGMSASCYCIPTSTDCTDGDIITNVTLVNLNNNSACGPAGYTNYTTNPAITVPNMVQGASVPISVTAGGGLFTEYVGVWVDYNQNGTFEASEFVLVGSTTGGTITNNLTVPAGALLGNTRMRVRVRFNTALAGGNACLAYVYGETEDYTVNIVPCVPVTLTAQPVSATVSCGGSATFSVTAAGSSPSYVWEYRTTPTGVWLTVPNSAPFSGVTSSTLTVSPVPVSFNGYEFRVVYSGACAGATPSSGATLTVNPFTLAITPSVYNVCSTGGTAALITVPNSSNTVTFTNNTVVPIPDGSATGASSPITVTGIPAGATITRIAVTINVTHAYVGDLVFNLKSPTATATTGILNLVGFLDGGTGSNSTANFTGTIIASDGVTALSGAPAPRTGTYKADALLITGGPTNGVANVTNWSSLLGTTNASGVWSLYAADGFAIDAGSINSWSISITYGAAPATAIFSPVTGLYNNAAATIPYAGTAVSQVYALPTTAGPNVYSAVISTATCTAAPQSITVNVNAPVTGPAVVANQSVCAGGNAVFSVTGLGGGPVYSYQWQVSTTAVPAFTNISGATASTFTVTAATLAQSGNRYQVIISGAGCSSTITSSIGTLTVNTNPVVVISASPNTVMSPTSPVTLTAAVSSATAPISYQWYLNGVAVTGATGATFTPDVNATGDYSVTVRDANNCAAATSTPISITLTRGATDIAFIYPSPNSGTFQVRYYNATANALQNQAAMVNVYDQKGSRVYTQRYVVTGPYTQMNVDLGTHSRGIYRVEISDANGNRLKTGTVMVF